MRVSRAAAGGVGVVVLVAVAVGVGWASGWLGSVAAGDGPGVPGGARSPERLEKGGIPNLYRLGPKLYSGAQPEGDAAFAALARLGVRTVITVDGAEPDLAAAHRHGLRYVHLPFGYDGVPRDVAVRLVKAFTESPGPVFVHCHHGKHRGPTAAAVCSLAAAGWTRAQARAWLNQAGTAPEYRGLFQTVQTFVPPTPAELAAVPPADLPERVEPPDLVAAMIEVDRHWSALKAALEPAGARTASPDTDPAHEALMLAEQFREAQRLDAAAARGPEFLNLMRAAERSATALHTLLRHPSSTPLAPALKRQAEACTQCHSRFRDPPEISARAAASGTPGAERPGR